MTELPAFGALTVSTPLRDSDELLPLSRLLPAVIATPRLRAARLNASRDGRTRRTVRSFAAPVTLRARTVISGAPERRRTLTDSDGFAAAPGAGTGTQLPTRLTGELSFAVWPVCDVNVVSMVAPVHSGLPTVNRPFEIGRASCRERAEVWRAA